MTKELDNIKLSIDALARRGNITRNQAFAAWYAINFYDIDEDSALESAGADGGNDQGIDIVFFDPNSARIIILQAHCPENTDNKTPKNKWDAVVASISYVRDPKCLQDAGRSDLADTLSTLKDENPDANIVIGLISLGAKSPEIENSLHTHRSDVRYKDIEFTYESKEDIIKNYQALIDSELGISEDKIHFSGDHFRDAGAYGQAWVGSVTASELKRLLDLYKDKLFAGNIRLFLGARKGGINEQMIDTAKKNPGNFWALNNGITIVADTVVPHEDNSSILKLRQFSIVNGCQTTNSLSQANAPKDAKVLVRVIEAKSNLKNEIVRYNNSQNAIKIWTVRAVDDIQGRLRKELKKIGVDYAPKQAGARKKHSENNIELDKITQYLASSKRDFLTQAVNNKSELFDEPYQKLYRRDIKAEEIYLAWTIGNMAEDERQALSDKLKANQDRHLIGVPSRYWIIYCVYKLLDEFSNIHSSSITLEKLILPEVKNTLRKYVIEAADLFYDIAVDTYEKDAFGTYKSAFRSQRFLEKVESKLDRRIVRLGEGKKKLPALERVAKSAKKL